MLRRIVFTSPVLIFKVNSCMGRWAAKPPFHHALFAWVIIGASLSA